MKNKKVIAGLGILAVAVVGGTWAYFNQTTTIDNPFSTTSFEGTTVEKFNPTDGGDWKPGVEVDKSVTAKNTGEGDVWVRVRFDEEWANAGVVIGSESDQFLPGSVNDNLQLDATDGKTAGDGSVVYKNIDAADWTKGSDGWYYYNETLGKGETTNSLMDSVTLCNNTDMGKYNESTYYKIVEKDADEPAFDDSWISYTGELKDALKELPEDQVKGKDVYTNALKQLDSTLKGYASDNYTLSIKTQFVQADAQAADASGWVTYPGK